MTIDCHVHIFPKNIREAREGFFRGEPSFELLYSPQGSRLVGCEELLEEMDRTGVEKSVIFGFPWERPEVYRRHNDYIMESVARHPDRLLGLGCFSLGSDACVEEARRCLDAGLSGLGELAVYKGTFSVHSIPALDPLMTLCRERDVPLLLHTNEPVGHHYPGKTSISLEDLYEFLKTYPDNRIILAHWGGGIFFYRLLKKEVGDVLKNTWFDTAASPFLYRQSVYRVAGEIMGFDRILLGSDYPLISPERYLREISRLSLTSKAFTMITRKNARTVFRLDP